MNKSDSQFEGFIGPTKDQRHAHSNIQAWDSWNEINDKEDPIDNEIEGKCPTKPCMSV